MRTSLPFDRHLIAVSLSTIHKSSHLLCFPIATSLHFFLFFLFTFSLFSLHFFHITFFSLFLQAFDTHFSLNFALPSLQCMVWGSIGWRKHLKRFASIPSFPYDISPLSIYILILNLPRSKSRRILILNFPPSHFLIQKKESVHSI